jgi:molybdate/tungstate transport system substrate-binding protein
MFTSSAVTRPSLALTAALILYASTAGCSGEPRSAADSATARGLLIVYNAGSLARPIRAALDSFSSRTGISFEQENAGSLETARKLTELGKIPDLIALADHEVFSTLLVPEYTTWFVRFARNRLVLAYGDQSRYGAEITPDNWRDVLLRAGVEVGRADPNLDPAGYRALMAMQLAERHYGDPGLAGRLLDAAPERNVRPKEVDLVALVQAGELDYVWQYESVARSTGLRFVQLPAAVDLGSASDSAAYAAAVVRVQGKGLGDTIELRGSPIIYGFSIPAGAPHPELAREFAAYLLGEGRAVMAAAHLPVNERPALVGSGAPPEVEAGTVRP